MDDARQAAGRDADRPVGHEHPAQSGWHFVDWGCEFLGTMVLVLGGISAVVLDFGAGSPVASPVPSHSLRLLNATVIDGLRCAPLRRPIGEIATREPHPANSRPVSGDWTDYWVTSSVL